MPSYSVDSLDKVLRALDNLQATVTNATKLPRNQCMVNHETLERQLDEIIDALPAAVKRAKDIVAQESAILEKARKEAEEKVKTARADAQRIADEAKKDASALSAAAKQDSDEAARLRLETKNSTEAEKKRAQQEADAMRAQARKELDEAHARAQQEIINAQQEGQRIYQLAKERANADAHAIVQEAQMRAEQETAADAVHQRAVIKAQEMHDAATQEAIRLRAQGIDYADSLLADADTYLTKVSEWIRNELINDIRNQRQSLQDMR